MGPAGAGALDEEAVLSMVPDERTERETHRRLVAHDRVDGVSLTDLREADPSVPTSVQQWGRASALALACTALSAEKSTA